MTEQELADRLFSSHNASVSTTANSTLIGTALEDSANGEVKTSIAGAEVGLSDDQSIVLSTTCSVSKGQSVIITLYGPDGHGKRAYISGIIGETPGADLTDITARVSALETDVTEINNYWGHYHLDRLYATSQLKGRGIYKIDDVSGTLRSKWPSSYRVGDYTGILHDYNDGSGNFSGSSCYYGSMIVTSPRTQSIFLVTIWEGAFSNVLRIY